VLGADKYSCGIPKELGTFATKRIEKIIVKNLVDLNIIEN